MTRDEQIDAATPMLEDRERQAAEGERPTLFAQCDACGLPAFDCEGCPEVVCCAACGGALEGEHGSVRNFCWDCYLLGGDPCTAGPSPS